MSLAQQEIRSLLNSIPEEFAGRLNPATRNDLRIFEVRALKLGVDYGVIQQLLDLYQVADNFSSDLMLAFHPCRDEVVFEWWAEQMLWLGQRDFYTLRWIGGKFCLGDASNPSFGQEYEFESLRGLIGACVREMIEVSEGSEKA